MAREREPYAPLTVPVDLTWTDDEITAAAELDAAIELGDESLIVAAARRFCETSNAQPRHSRTVTHMADDDTTPATGNTVAAIIARIIAELRAIPSASQTTTWIPTGSAPARADLDDGVHNAIFHLLTAVMGAAVIGDDRIELR